MNDPKRTKTTVTAVTKEKIKRTGSIVLSLLLLVAVAVLFLSFLDIFVIRCRSFSSSNSNSSPDSLLIVFLKLQKVFKISFDKIRFILYKKKLMNIFSNV